MLSLNDRAWQLCDQLAATAEQLGVAVSTGPLGVRLIDCGAKVAGSAEAGRLLAEICLAGLGTVKLVPGDESLWPGMAVTVQTDQPATACMASQYAGWQLTGEKFFAMGSGPMRAAAKKEALFDHLAWQEQATRVVGVLETSKLPPESVCQKIATDCGVSPEQVTLLIARTASIAGTIQVVARSVETALHKLHELGLDLAQIVAGEGSAPLPPIAPDDMTGIGWTNDSVLYGGKVHLKVRGDDAYFAQLAPQVPSCASADFGEPFGSIFKRYNHDFYKIDPLLFSPAVVTLENIDTGTIHRHGMLRGDVLRKSFGG